MIQNILSSKKNQIRVALMRHTNGILHAKFGIVTDVNGDRIAFMGSDNETGAAFTDLFKSVSPLQLTNRGLRVLVCTDAASEGLNLQAAGALINYAAYR